MNDELNPIGAIPHQIWIEMRVQELNRAIKEYELRNLFVPVRWYTELELLDNYLKDMGKPLDTK